MDNTFRETPSLCFEGPFAHFVVYVVLEAGLILEAFAAFPFTGPVVVLRVGQLVSGHAGQLEEGFVADGAEVDPLLDVHLADVTVQSVTRSLESAPILNHRQAQVRAEEG